MVSWGVPYPVDRAHLIPALELSAGAIHRALPVSCRTAPESQAQAFSTVSRTLGARFDSSVFIYHLLASDPGQREIFSAGLYRPIFADPLSLVTTSFLPHTPSLCKPTSIAWIFRPSQLFLDPAPLKWVGNRRRQHLPRVGLHLLQETFALTWPSPWARDDLGIGLSPSFPNSKLSLPDFSPHWGTASS